jgi:hypothetical protein
MIANDLTVANAIDAGNHVFVLSSVTGSNSVRTNTAITLPHTLTIKHELLVKGNIKYRRSLIRVDRTRLDAYAGLRIPHAVYLVIEHPIDYISDSKVTATIEDLTDVLALSGVIDKLLAGEP